MVLSQGSCTDHCLLPWFHRHLFNTGAVKATKESFLAMCHGFLCILNKKDGGMCLIICKHRKRRDKNHQNEVSPQSHFKVNWLVKLYGKVYCNIMALDMAALHKNMPLNTIRWYQNTIKQEYRLYCSQCIALRNKMGWLAELWYIHSVCTLL